MPIFKKPQAPATLEEQIRDAAQRLCQAIQYDPLPQPRQIVTERERAPSRKDSVTIEPRRRDTSLFTMFKSEKSQRQSIHEQEKALNMLLEQYLNNNKIPIAVDGTAKNTQMYHVIKTIVGEDAAKTIKKDVEEVSINEMLKNTGTLINNLIEQQGFLITIIDSKTAENKAATLRALKTGPLNYSGGSDSIKRDGIIKENELQPLSEYNRNFNILLGKDSHENLNVAIPKVIDFLSKHHDNPNAQKLNPKETIDQLTILLTLVKIKIKSEEAKETNRRSLH